MKFSITVTKYEGILPSWSPLQGKKHLFVFLSIAIHLAASHFLGSRALSSNQNRLEPVSITVLSESLPRQGDAVPDRTGKDAPAKAAQMLLPSRSLAAESRNSMEESSTTVPDGTQPANTASVPKRPEAQPVFSSAKEDALYLRPQELTERPQLLQDIDATLRITAADFPTQTAILRLLINELGYIDKVEVDKSRLPEEVEKMVSEAFSALKFIPGKLNGTPVKTWIKIEVLLDNTIKIPVAPNIKI